MHVKTLGYPIGCPPKIFNEDYHSLRFFYSTRITYALKCLKKIR